VLAAQGCRQGCLGIGLRKRSSRARLGLHGGPRSYVVLDIRVLLAYVARVL